MTSTFGVPNRVAAKAVAVGLSGHSHLYVCIGGIIRAALHQAEG